MVSAAGVSREVFRRTCGVAAYLDDLSIVAPPDVAVVGLRVFQEEVAKRGWRVNLDKTVCGVGYYELDVDRRAAMLATARDTFNSLLRRDMVQSVGQVLLGTPLGADSADLHVGREIF